MRERSFNYEKTQESISSFVASNSQKNNSVLDKKIQLSKKTISASDFSQEEKEHIQNVVDNNTAVLNTNKDPLLTAKATITFVYPLSFEELFDFLNDNQITNNFVSGQILLEDATISTFMSNATTLSLSEIQEITLDSAESSNGVFLGYTSIRGILNVNMLNKIQSSKLVILVELCQISENGDYLTNPYAEDLAWEIATVKGVTK
ncbi:MAG: hypothetical protein IJC55_00800 [Clostridia bacterium]|nr:hypothetical protein [Clostridia bacterium]